MKIIETSLRDGQQSLLSTRLSTEEILSIVSDLDHAGLYALEVWGGATFDASLRFLGEDPWERLKKIRASVKNTKLQMLLRGQNLLGYKHYDDEIVDLFVKKAIENGIDIIRIFDALNDFNNLKTAVEATIKYGGHCQIAISYTTSPVHDIAYFVDLAIQAEKMGAHSICIKDMAGLLLPYTAEKLILEIKNHVHIELNLHGHDTAGVMSAVYLKAIDAGVDMIDTALSPLSSGTSQPPTETFYQLLKDRMEFDDLNIDVLKKAQLKLTKIVQRYIDDNTLLHIHLIPNPSILTYQVPGGMISNLMSQLKQQQILHLYQDVLEEIPAVRKDFGYPPLVTPISQIVGVQATLNVMTKERYKIIPREVKDYLLLKYGIPPAPINKELIKKAELNQFQSEVLENNQNEQNLTFDSDEDYLTYNMFPEIYLKFKMHQLDDKPQHYKYTYSEHNLNLKTNMIHAPISGLITKVYKHTNNQPKEGSLLVELTLDKLTISVIAPYDFEILECYVEENTYIKENDYLFKTKKTS